METTKKLYDLDAYETQFEATVLACEMIEQDETKVYQVVLDQTLFFPEEGGQTPDKGILGGRTVLDVQTKKGIIYHTLDGEVTVGEKLKGEIDWTHRFNNMQQHSGEHIFSGLVHKRFGYDNVGFHLSDQIVTMDFNGVITAEEAAEIEKEANKVIISNLPVVVSFPSKEELRELDYRSKIEIEGQVRIVTVPGVDVCACCAPHVKLTGEIGLLKVLSLQSHRGGVRLSILCGFRALSDFRQKTNVIAELSSSLSANQDTVVEAVEKLKSTSQATKFELIAAKKECLQAKLAGIPKEQADVVVFESNLDAGVMRDAINQLVKEHEGICAIFTGTDKEGYRFIIGSETKDTREVLARLKENYEVRGGGSPKMVQGSIVAKEQEITAVL